MVYHFVFFFQAEDGIRDLYVTGVQTCALPILLTDAVPGLRSRVFSAIKLRGAIARVGNDAPVYSLAPVYIGNANKFSGQPQFALDPALANANLKPEITRSDE